MNLKVRLRDKTESKIVFPNMELMFESICLEKPISSYDVELQTEFVDIKNIKIYEGDILHSELYDKKYMVIFKNGYFQLSFLGDGFDILKGQVLSQLIINANFLSVW
jgi:hypothetical protein